MIRSGNLTQTVHERIQRPLTYHLVLRPEHVVRAIEICDELLEMGLPERQRALVALIKEKMMHGSDTERSLYLVHLYTRIVGAGGLEGMLDRVFGLITAAMPEGEEHKNYFQNYVQHWTEHLLEQASPEFREIAESCLGETGPKLAVKLCLLLIKKFAAEEWVYDELEVLIAALLPKGLNFADFFAQVAFHHQEFGLVERIEGAYQRAQQNLAEAGTALEEGFQERLKELQEVNRTRREAHQKKVDVLKKSQGAVESVAARLAKLTKEMMEDGKSG